MLFFSLLIEMHHVFLYFSAPVSMYVNDHADDMDVNSDAYEKSHKLPLLDIPYSANTSNAQYSYFELSHLYHPPQLH